MSIMSLPFYNLINIFFIGVLFSIGAASLFPKLMTHSDKLLGFNSDSFVFCIIAVAIVYEIGIVIDRLASLITERILKSKKSFENRSFLSQLLQMQWKDYAHFQKAEKKSENIKTLTREYIFSRNNLTLFVILCGAALGMEKYIHAILFGDLGLLFYFSMKKHADKIAQRVDFSTDGLDCQE